MNDAQEINADFMLQYGLRLIGHRLMRSHSKNVANFRQAFGASPDSAANIWMDLRQSTDENIRLDSTGASIAHLFWTFYFLKTYPKQRNLTAAFRSRCSKTLMRWIKHYIYKLSMLKEYKIVFPETPVLKRGEWRFLLTVDGTDCPIEEPRPFSTTWFSHKFKGAALKYEIGVDMDGNIVWISTPYRGGVNDKTIFKRGLESVIPVGYLAIADQGYTAGPKLSIISEFDSQEVAIFKKRTLSRHETANKRLKDFACLTTEFRHGVDMHCFVFDAVATICQYNITNGEPLFAI